MKTPITRTKDESREPKIDENGERSSNRHSRPILNHGPPDRLNPKASDPRGTTGAAPRWGLAVCLLTLAMLLSTPASPAQSEPAPIGGEDRTGLRWLASQDGQRRGIVLSADLRREGTGWQLWGPSAAGRVLSPLRRLLPAGALDWPGFAVNGGFWNEFDHPVGVCAGEQGIFAAQSHPGGFVIAGGRAWIGQVTCEITLESSGARPSEGSQEEAGTRVSVNPRPVLKKSPYLIDFRTYPGGFELKSEAVVTRLRPAGEQAVRFNRDAELVVRSSARQGEGTRIEPGEGPTLVLVRPATAQQADAPALVAEEVVRLRPHLTPGDGPVQLVTCAGPILLRQGRINEELLTPEQGEARRAHRTAVGCNAEGRRMWVVALLRGSDGKPGATLHETALTLLELGATDALNLDGGSSTSVWSSHLGLQLRALLPIQRPIHHGIYFGGDLEVLE